MMKTRRRPVEIYAQLQYLSICGVSVRGGESKTAAKTRLAHLTFHSAKSSSHDHGEEEEEDFIKDQHQQQPTTILLHCTTATTNNTTPSTTTMNSLYGS